MKCDGCGRLVSRLHIVELRLRGWRKLCAACLSRCAELRELSEAEAQ